MLTLNKEKTPFSRSWDVTVTKVCGIIVEANSEQEALQKVSSMTAHEIDKKAYVIRCNPTDVNQTCLSAN